jgi:hypothetical protein
MSGVKAVSRLLFEGLAPQVILGWASLLPGAICLFAVGRTGLCRSVTQAPGGRLYPDPGWPCWSAQFGEVGTVVLDDLRRLTTDVQAGKVIVIDKVHRLSSRAAARATVRRLPLMPKLLESGQHFLVGGEAELQRLKGGGRRIAT